MLVGIAIDERKLRGVDQTLAELLPAYAATMPPAVKAVTLGQVLTMTAGLPPDPPDLPGFVTSSDWVTTILTDGTQQPAGQGFAYSSAGSHLLSAILRQATGRSNWTTPGRSCSPRSASAPSRLPSRSPGRKAGPPTIAPASPGRPTRRATTPASASSSSLPATWPSSASSGSTRPLGRPPAGVRRVGRRVHPVPCGHTKHPERYGYQWWVTTADGHAAYAAMGYGGQLVEVVPDLGLVTVVASTYATGAAGPEVYLDLVSSYIAPAIKQ